MITKVLVGAAIAVVAATGVAAPITADPNPFANISCSSCKPGAPASGPVVTGQITKGIQQAFSDLQA